MVLCTKEHWRESCHRGMMKLFSKEKHTLEKFQAGYVTPEECYDVYITRKWRGAEMPTKWDRDKFQEVLHAKLGVSGIDENNLSCFETFNLGG